MAVRWIAIGVCAVAACGRFGFDDVGGVGGGDGGGSDGAIDAEDVPGVTRIYRSIGPGLTTAIVESDTAGPMTITSGVARFDVALPSHVGIGDALIVDGVVHFIHGRDPSEDPASYVVRTPTGGMPADKVGSSWRVYRAYTDPNSAIAGAENPGIDTGVRDFDTGSRDLVAANEQWSFALYADAPSPAIRFIGWVTDATHYLRLFAPDTPAQVGTSQRHAGVWDAAKATMISEDYFGTINNENEVTQSNHVRIDGLQIENFRSVGPAEGSGINFDDFDIGTAMDGEVYISNCLIRKSGTLLAGVEHAGIWINGPQLKRIVIYNNVIVGFQYGFRHTAVANLEVEVYNNTIVGQNTLGIALDTAGAGDMFRVKNNLVVGATTAYSSGANPASDYSNNHADDGSALGPNPTVSAIMFVDPAGFDYRLSLNDTLAIDSALDLSNAPHFTFSTDAAGNSRGVWDRGAFAY